MGERIQWAIGQKVKVVDKGSPYFGKVGILITTKQFPVVGKMPYHWYVEIDNNSVLFAQEQLARIE